MLMMLYIAIWITALVRHATAPVAMAQGTVEPARFAFADVHRQAADLANGLILLANLNPFNLSTM
jgi:hypothetical protein